MSGWHGVGDQQKVKIAVPSTPPTILGIRAERSYAVMRSRARSAARRPSLTTGLHAAFDGDTRTDGLRVSRFDQQSHTD